MRAILKKMKSENGAASIIEMTLIFPLVVSVLCFFLYLGSYIMQNIIIYNDAQRIAVAASRVSGMPGYEKMYGTKGVTSVADFDWKKGTSPDIGLVNDMMNEHAPYRYFGNGFLTKSEANTLENNMKKLVNNSSFLVKSTVTCDINTENNFINQKVIVHVKKAVSVPKFFSNLGIKDKMDIDITTTAVVSDPAEFVRNTDMIFDLKDYLFENIKIGGESINQKINKYKQKFTDIAGKIGIKW